ncbi:MAG: hypothetical protein KME52_25205 [Desmonostoc geniculatum HA4340-LM1]|jgi:hypothetical protein|nr:hypothetical protein [Desmonostoc geniculatum HA4340-LM1]
MSKYKNPTTWTGNSWRSGATKVIRIPIALQEKIMVYARSLDEENAV